MTSATARRAFDHVLVIMFENQYRSYVLQNPYFRRLAREGIQLANYFGVMHPSQTNYIASIAGALCNVTSDGPPPLIGERTIVDLIEEGPGGLRWKAYMDSYVPGSAPWTQDFQPIDAPPYYSKHNPFSSFASIVRNESRWRRVENEAALFADLLNGEFPEYAWFTPNIWNDGHYLDGTKEESKPRAPGLVDQSARWLEGFFGRLRFPGPDTHLPPRTLVVITYDEADFETDYIPDLASAYDGPNHVYTVLLGDVVEPGIEEEGYNHYSLLRTIELNFDLEHLGKNDDGANWFQFLWGREFQWSGPQPTPIAAPGALCAAGHAGALFVACAAADGFVHIRTRTGDHWSEEEVLPIDGSGGIGMASASGELVLVVRTASGALQSLTYDLPYGWSQAASLPGEPVGSAFAMASFDRDQRVMLAVRNEDGSVDTYVWSNGQWGSAVAVPAAKTDGELTLAALGAALYLIVKTPGEQTMNVISYNTAPYNVVTVPQNQYGGAQDTTTIEEWSPSAFPVAHFSSWPDKNTNERQPHELPYESGPALAAATLHGVIHLVHPGPGNPQLTTETFSIAGLMTPSQPVSYKQADSPTASNGFGTLAEAGWSLQTPIFGARCAAGGALTMTRAGNEILLLTRSAAGAPVELRIGRYERK